MGRKTEVTSGVSTAGDRDSTGKCSTPEDSVCPSRYLLPEAFPDYFTLLLENSWGLRNHSLALASPKFPVTAWDEGQPSLHHLVITKELSHVRPHLVLLMALGGKNALFTTLGLRYRAV